MLSTSPSVEASIWNIWNFHCVYYATSVIWILNLHVENFNRHFVFTFLGAQVKALNNILEKPGDFHYLSLLTI